jgi:hypothetical protein
LTEIHGAEDLLLIWTFQCQSFVGFTPIFL